MGFENSQAFHCTGNQLESCAAQHLVPLKYGQGGLESFKAALLEHFMSTDVCCLHDRCSKGWGWTGADVMSLWNSTDCRNHPAGLKQELKVVLAYLIGKQLTAQGEANPWLGFWGAGITRMQSYMRGAGGDGWVFFQSLETLWGHSGHWTACMFLALSRKYNAPWMNFPVLILFSMAHVVIHSNVMGSKLQ